MNGSLKNGKNVCLSLQMVSAIVQLAKTDPVSYNSSNVKKKEKYMQLIRDSFDNVYNGKVPKYRNGCELYGQVCFFTSEGTDLDADNISKPVWDALEGLVYDNDKQIVMRKSSVIYKAKHELIALDGYSDRAADLLQIIMKKSVKCIYIECGHFKESMIEMDLEELYEDR